MVAPYRVPLYEALATAFDVTILYSGHEPNRAAWAGTERRVRGARVERAWGFALRLPAGTSRIECDTRLVHINPGLITRLLRLRPHAVISSEMGFRTLVACCYCALFRRPLWVHWGGTPHTERAVGAVRRAMRRLLARVVPRWLSYGATSTDYLRSLGVPVERVLELQNCVDESLFERRAPRAVELRPRPVVLYAGQLIRRKGVDLLLEAGAALQHAGREFTLLLVGDGPERARLERRAAELRLRNVVFRPAAAPEEMGAVYRAADALVLPTLADPWGLVVNEALWSGLPVLASVYAGCATELLPPGAVFDPLDPLDFREKLRAAVDGQLPAPDRSCLRRAVDVARAVVDDVGVALARPRRAALALAS
jgi:glycosyltransferase involved in cell wall biosynthesis